MAAYMRRQENSAQGAGHNKNETATRRRMPGVDFEEMNFEQRRAPYGNSNRTNEADEAVDHHREDVADRRDNG